MADEKPHGGRVMRPFFRWYDLWVGAYWDRQKRTLYICPLPMFGVAITFARRKPSRVSPNNRVVRAWGDKRPPAPSHTDRATAVCESLLDAEEPTKGER